MKEKMCEVTAGPFYAASNFHRKLPASFYDHKDQLLTMMLWGACACVTFSGNIVGVAVGLRCQLLKYKHVLNTQHANLYQSDRETAVCSLLTNSRSSG